MSIITFTADSIIFATGFTSISIDGIVEVERTGGLAGAPEYLGLSQRPNIGLYLGSKEYGIS